MNRILDRLRGRKKKYRLEIDKDTIVNLTPLGKQMADKGLGYTDQSAVIAVIAETPNCSIKKIASHLDMDIEEVKNLVNDLSHTGYVVFMGGER